MALQLHERTVVVTQEQRYELERIAAHLESIARNIPKEDGQYTLESQELFSISWDIKCVSRFGTPSFGV